MNNFGSEFDILTPITVNIFYCLRWLNHFHPFVWNGFSPSMLELLLTFIIFEKMLACFFIWLDATSESGMEKIDR